MTNRDFLMRAFVLIFLFLFTVVVILSGLVLLVSAAADPPRVNVELGSPQSRVLTAQERAAIQYATDRANRQEGCDLVRKTCASGAKFVDPDTYLSSRIGQLLERHVAEMERDRRLNACATYKALPDADKQPIRDRLGGDPC